MVSTQKKAFKRFLLIVTLIVSIPISADAITRIMPLGDSITKGTHGSIYTWGYRKPLYDRLTNSGYSFDFVGSCADGIFPDPNHEGLNGWRADEILNGRPSEPGAGKLEDWLVTYQPDVVLLHIGTNDIAEGNQDANEVNDILNVIDDYEADSNEHITVILALIINRMTYSPATTQYNDDVNVMALNRIAGGDDIIIVDMESALDYPADMYDNLHPNDTGYAKIAQAWYDALAGFFNESKGRLEEVNQRLELTTTGRHTDFADFYNANGWSFNAAEDFAISIDFHYSDISDEEGWIGMSVGDDSNYVAISVGSGDNASYFYYDAAVDGNVVFEQEPRTSNDGTLYVSFDSASGTFYLSHTGFGSVNEYDWQATNPTQGPWSEPVKVTVGGGSTGAALSSGEAYLDDFQINSASLVNWPPATDLDGDGYIDIYDLEILCENWLGADGGDIDNKGIVDFLDYSELCLAW